MAQKLPNYLGTYRKRAGFSQHELAFLLGTHSGSKISRYERSAREPHLKTVLAYQVIFRIPPHELFAGTYQQVERVIAQRSQQLRKQLTRHKGDRLTARKLETLRLIPASKKK